MSYNAYQQTQNAAEQPRQTEYRLFAEVTRKLISANDRSELDTVTMEALDWNRRLWSTLSTDCGAEGNSLTPEIRAGIISLSIWVSKHTSLIMQGNEKIEDLISINKTIMEGLALQPGQTDSPSTQSTGTGKPITPYSGPTSI